MRNIDTNRKEMIDKNDAEQIDNILSALSKFDATKAREFVKAPGVLTPLITVKGKNCTHNLTCLYAWHAVLLTLFDKDHTEILNEMSDTDIALLKQGLDTVATYQCPDLKSLNKNIAIRANQLKTGKKEIDVNTYRNMSAEERAENKYMLKAMKINKEVATCWSDASAELKKWQTSIDNFKREPKVVEQVIIDTPKEDSALWTIAQLADALTKELGKTVTPKQVKLHNHRNLKSQLDKYFVGNTKSRRFKSEFFGEYKDSMSDKTAKSVKAPRSQKTTTQAVTDKLSLDIREIGLFKHTVNCLLCDYIGTVGDLVQKTKDDLRNLRGFGRETMRDVESTLNKMGLCLKSSDEKSALWTIAQLRDKLSIKYTKPIHDKNRSIPQDLKDKWFIGKKFKSEYFEEYKTYFAINHNIAKKQNVAKPVKNDTLVPVVAQKTVSVGLNDTSFEVMPQQNNIQFLEGVIAIFKETENLYQNKIELRQHIQNVLAKETDTNKIGNLVAQLARANEEVKKLEQDVEKLNQARKLLAEYQHATDKLNKVNAEIAKFLQSAKGNVK